MSLGEEGEESGGPHPDSGLKAPTVCSQESWRVVAKVGVKCTPNSLMDLAVWIHCGGQSVLRTQELGPRTTDFLLKLRMAPEAAS